jgi:hypothetical protein
MGAFDVVVARSADLQKLYLATAVFHGSGYLPGSVRDAVSQVGLLAAGQGVSGRLVLDEEVGEVRLHYQLHWTPDDQGQFVALVEEFLAVADEWRRLLDEYGQQDLVWVRR